MASDLDKLLAFLEVEQVDKFLFIGDSPRGPKRIFGGQVLAQALNAAIRTVDEERSAHSMHAYFLRPGNPEKQIVFDVDPIRDGRSFNTRRVVAKQDGIAIFNTAISFHIQEPGLSHRADMPDMPPPEEVESDRKYWARVAKMANPDKPPEEPFEPIERKPVEPRDFLDPQPREPFQNIWMRGLGDLGDDPASAPDPARLHVGFCAPGHGAVPAPLRRVQRRHPGRQPGPRPVVPPPLPRGRIPAVRAGEPECRGGPRVQPRRLLHPRRRAGGLNGTGVTAAGARGKEGRVTAWLAL